MGLYIIAGSAGPVQYTVYTVQDRVQYVPWDMIPFLIIISLNRGHSTARVYIPALRSGTGRVSSRRLD